MNTLSHLTICSKSGLQISQSLQSLFCRFHTHGSLRICVCVCRLLFQQKRLTWSSCNQTTLASGVRPKKFHVSPGRIGRARRCSRGLQSRPARVSGLSALHRAAQQGDAAEVQRLIEAGADVELQDRTDYRQGALETPKGVGCISLSLPTLAT